MQATLLSIAIALILALVAALVGPHFVDWNNYRAQFEAQTRRLTGLQVRIGGPIEARLLPTPSLSLQRIDVAQQEHAGSLQARRLRIEFSLGALARGEFRATEVVLEGAEFSAALDRGGRVEWPAPAVTFDPDAIAVDRLEIRDGRLLLADAASGYGMVLDRFEFKGELRTLSGPVKGQGSFTADGQHYPFRLAASRVGDDRVRVRLNIDPIDRPLTVDVEGFLSIDDGVPRFAGTMSMARPLTRAPAGLSAEILESWRLSAKIDGNSQRAVIEQIEFQYGPDERPIRLRGDARINFGAAPHLIGVISSPQIDLDRILGLAEAERRRPAAVVRALGSMVAGVHRPPMPVALGVSFDSVTLAGATLQRISGDFASEGSGWNIERLDVRAPGLSQLAMSGRIDLAHSISFSGRVRLGSREPRALMAWLTDRPEGEMPATSSLGVEGDVKLSSQAVAIDGLRAELDRMTVEGRIAYAWADREKPPRLEASFSAPEIDLDRSFDLLQRLSEGTSFEWPREGQLSAKIERGTLAGVEARRADIGVRFDAQGVRIERFAIDDFGGASLAVRGMIGAQASRGTVTVDLDARRLDGLVALLDRLSPAVAANLRREAGRLVPAKFSGSLEFKPNDSSATDASGQFRLVGNAGALRVGLSGDVGVAREALTIVGAGRWGSARLDLGGEIDTRDSAALIVMLGLDRLVAARSGGARLRGTVRGPLDGELALETHLAGDGLDVVAKGTARLTAAGAPAATVDVTVARANLRIPRFANAATDEVAVTGATRLSLADGLVTLSDLSGTIGGTEVGGRLTIGLAEPVKVGGELSLGALHLPAMVAAIVGVPKVVGASWPAEPFEQGLIGNAAGTLTISIARTALSPQLAVANLRGVLQLGANSLSLEDIEGTIAGGRATGSVNFERGGNGLSFDGHVRLSAADLAGLLPGDGVLAGRANIVMDVRGAGRSPVALIGSLTGEGSFVLEDGAIMRFDPAAFADVTRSVDEGLPIDPVRIRERMEAALDRGALRIELAQGEIAIAAGQLRISKPTLRARDADLDAGLSIDLTAGDLDARLTLSSLVEAQAKAGEGLRPAIALSLRGPFGELKRTLDVVAFVNWLAVRAIEQRDKHIDALQTGHPLPGTPVQPPMTPPAMTPVAVPVPQKPIVPPAAPKATPQRPSTAKAPPPPTDIRPPPATRPQPPSKQAQPQRSAPRSWLENLLGP